MTARPIHFVAAGTVLVAAAGSMAFSGIAGADTIRSSGTSQNIDVSWIEYDLDNVLGLPGNTHVGYLYAYGGQYGTFIGGNVTDFDCDPGEKPWGGHGIAVAVIDQAGETSAAAIGDAIDEIVDTGGTYIDADFVADEIKNQLADDIPDTIEDEFEEFPVCDWIQDRFLEGNDTTKVSVDLKKRVARMTGTINVTNGHGGHGEEPPVVLATPPIDLTITGGEWNDWAYSWSFRGAGYSYSSSERGTGFYGGTVTGRIGGMGFADDDDDESYGGFGTSRYQSVERVR